jgi:hypothetical protein
MKVLVQNPVQQIDETQFISALREQGELIQACSTAENLQDCMANVRWVFDRGVENFRYEKIGEIIYFYQIFINNEGKTTWCNPEDPTFSVFSVKA